MFDLCFVLYILEIIQEINQRNAFWYQKWKLQKQPSGGFLNNVSSEIFRKLECGGVCVQWQFMPSSSNCNERELNYGFFFGNSQSSYSA